MSVNWTSGAFRGAAVGSPARKASDTVAMAAVLLALVAPSSAGAESMSSADREAFGVAAVSADCGAPSECAEQIQKAFNSGRLVLFPRGRIEFNEPINVPSGIRVTGMGPGSTRLVYTGSGPAAFYNDDSHGWAGYMSDFRLEAPCRADTDTDVMRFERGMVNFAKLERIYFRCGRYGIYFGNIDPESFLDATMENIFMQRQARACVAFEGRVSGVITKPICHSPAIAGFEFINPDNNASLTIIEPSFLWHKESVGRRAPVFLFAQGDAKGMPLTIIGGRWSIFARRVDMDELDFVRVTSKGSVNLAIVNMSVGNSLNDPLPRGLLNVRGDIIPITGRVVKFGD